MNDMSAFDDDLLLAEALDHALVQRRFLASDTPGLTGLVTLARTLEASASGVAPSAAFRAAARERLVTHMAFASPLRSPSVARLARRGLQPVVNRVAVWSARFAAGIAALSLAGAAAASASASALPGEPLYVIKEAGEALAVQTAPGDAARQQVLLRQAHIRLDETARLLEQGRDTEAAATALRYDEAVDGAAAGSPPAEAMETSLRADRARLAELLQHAPQPARGGLERALSAAERGLARANAARGVDPALPTEPRQQSSTEKIRLANEAVRPEGDEAPAPTANDHQAEIREGPEAESEAHATPVGEGHPAAPSEVHEAENSAGTDVAVDDGKHASHGKPGNDRAAHVRLQSSDGQQASGHPGPAQPAGTTPPALTSRARLDVRACWWWVAT